MLCYPPARHTHPQHMQGNWKQRFWFLLVLRFAFLSSFLITGSLSTQDCFWFPTDFVSLPPCTELQETQRVLSATKKIAKVYHCLLLPNCVCCVVSPASGCLHLALFDGLQQLSPGFLSLLFEKLSNLLMSTGFTLETAVCAYLKSFDKKVYLLWVDLMCLGFSRKGAEVRLQLEKHSMTSLHWLSFYPPSTFQQLLQRRSQQQKYCEAKLDKR